MARNRVAGLIGKTAPVNSLVVVAGLFYAVYPEYPLTVGDVRTILLHSVSVGLAALGMSIVIVSGGIDLVIHDLLAREGVAVDEIWAPRLLEHQDGRLALEFPPSLGRSRCGSDFCKCSLFEPSASRPLRILIGDGRSDFCCAHWADRVFARSQLIAYCRAHAVEFLRFENFSGIRRTIERWARRPLAGVPVAAGSPVDA